MLLIKCFEKNVLLDRGKLLLKFCQAKEKNTTILWGISPGEDVQEVNVRDEMSRGREDDQGGCSGGGGGS